MRWRFWIRFEQSALVSLPYISMGYACLLTYPGQLKPDGMITSRIALDEVVDKGFKALLEHRDQHCKILVGVQA